jgi:glycosyltransferase involved in cell wall biosynthesis
MASSETVNQKVFSIILATYNCGQKVGNTLQSILSQNEELFELIVVDGASTDDTLDYIRKYESDLTLISEKDDGVYDAFNKGIDIARGKYIYFIGAGDCLRPGILEQVKEFLPQEIPTFVYGDFYLMKQKVRAAKKYRSSDFIFNNICHQAVFYHRTIFDIVGKYDLRYKVFADWIFNLKCFTHQEISKQYIPCLIADFEEGGLSSELNNDLVFKKDFPLLVKKQLGISAYLKCKAFMINPGLYSFSYNAGRAFLEYLISFARPYVQGYRHLKKAIRNKI